MHRIALLIVSSNSVLLATAALLQQYFGMITNINTNTITVRTSPTPKVEYPLSLIFHKPKFVVSKFISSLGSTDCFPPPPIVEDLESGY